MHERFLVLPVVFGIVTFLTFGLLLHKIILDSAGEHVFYGN